MNITASCKLNGHDLTEIHVLNPGGWFGKTWLIEIGGSYTPLFLVVEADTISDAIDELSDNKTYGHQLHVLDEDLAVLEAYPHTALPLDPRIEVHTRNDKLSLSYRRTLAELVQL